METLLIFQPKWVSYMSKNIYCLIKTCAVISNSLLYSVKLSTLYSALNPQWWPSAVHFNLFCYGTPLKIFWRTHAPYLLTLQPCPPPNCAHACKYPGLNKQAQSSVTQLNNSSDNGSLSVAYESQIITTISLTWSDAYAPHFIMCKGKVKSWKSLVV